jgi:hypothetical protein
MTDFKFKLGASLLIALVLAVLTIGLLNPIVIWYLNFVPQIFSCGSAGVFCEVSDSILIFAIPVIAIFLGVFGVLEVFLK